MKNIYRLMAMAATVAAFASCNKENVDEGTPQPGISQNSLSITVGNETKTLLRGTIVHWSYEDQLKVFDADTGFVFKTTKDYSDKSVAVFTCDTYTGGTPLMAVHCQSADKSTYDNGKNLVSANLSSTQTIYHKASYAKNAGLAVGQITGDAGSYTVEAMKQCFSLLQFTLVDTSVVSITVKGNNGETLAGGVDINYSSIEGGNDFWTSNSAQGAAANEIKLTANGSACKVKSNGAFADSTKYYVSILPQTLAKGVTFVMTRRDGKMATREINSSIALNRAKIKKLAHPVDSGLVYKAGNIVIDCTNAANFLYNNGEKDVALPARKSTINDSFDFWLNGKVQYKFNGKAMNWGGFLNTAKVGGASNPIKLPTIDGYELSAVDIMAVKHSINEYTYSITDGTNELAFCKMVNTTSAQHLDLSKVTTTSSDRYLLNTNELDVKFILTYSPAE